MKTLTSLWAADFLMQIGAIKRCLIIAPVSTLLTTWGMEIFTNLFHRKYRILYGSKQQRLKHLNTDCDFYVINPDGLKVIEKELRARKDIDHFIVDEGALWRNSQTDRYEALENLCGPKTHSGLWWMTGSPMPKAPTDVWAQARLVNPATVPMYFSRFRNMVMYKASEYKWKPRQNWERYCYSVLQPSIRFERDRINIPECITLPREVEMSTEQKAAYNQMAALFKAELREGSITAVNEGVKLGKLNQIACGAVYGKDGDAIQLDVRPKFTDLLRVLEECGGKAIVFMPYRHILDHISEKIRKSGYSVATVHGGVSKGRRDDIFHQFSHGSLQILTAQPQCMSHGLNLAAAHTIVWWGPPSSFETYEQANGRIRRPGQKFRQTIVRLYCSEIEKRIYQRIDKQQSTQGILLELLTHHE